jgi:hypothetical protein
MLAGLVKFRRGVGLARRVGIGMGCHWFDFDSDFDTDEHDSSV